LLQAENCNLEKADILEMTVSQLRQMVASTEMQCVYGYRVCVQEVNDFLLGTRYDDTTRRRIVQHLCRRRPSLVPAAGIRQTAPTSITPTVPADAESASGDSAGDYEHLRMFSYSSADSTTDGAADPCEAGSATISTTNNNTDASFKYDGEETNNNNSELTAARFDRGADKILQRVESTDDVAAVMDVHMKDTDAVESGSNDAVLSPMWRPW